MIGKWAYAKPNKDPHWTEFRYMGVVVNETKHTVVVQQDSAESKRTVTLLKTQYVFQFQTEAPANNVLATIYELPGNLLEGAPENRIKSIRKRRLKLT